MVPSHLAAILMLTLDLLKNAPADFKMRLLKGNTVMNQFLRVDPAHETETFHVLPFDKVEESVIVHDFNKNWTVILLPKKKQCFLKRLNPGIPTPQQLKQSIQKIISSNKTNGSTGIDVEEKTTWKVRSSVVNRRFLSQKMQTLCKNLPMSLIKKINGKLSIQSTSRRTGRSPRFTTRGACGGSVCNVVYYQVFECFPCRWVQKSELRCRDIQC